MLDSISPYALLRACRPKPPDVIVTPYDLYSAAQSSNAAAPVPSAPSAPPMPDDCPGAQPTPSMPPAQTQRPYAQPTPSVPPAMPTRRTHYIRDIGTRHESAMRRTSQTGGFQPSQRPPT